MAYIYGTRGNDSLKGTSGGDNFYGRGGSDEMHGDGGNDTFFANNGGSDTLFGGTGSDTVNYSKITQAAQSFWGFDGVVVDLAAGGGTEVNYSGTEDHYSSIENVTGSNYRDYILGDSNANILRGLAGDDLIEGRGGGDTLDGGEGIDTLDYYHSTARVVVSLESNSASEGDAKGDVISNFENLRGSAYNDVLTGNGASNSIVGGSGHDRINGRGGADSIQGGAGNDILTGGSGADTFEYFTNTTSSGTDHITDFNVYEDRIDLHVTASYPNGDISYSVSGNDGYTVDIDITLGSSGHVILDNIPLADVGLVFESVHIV